METKVKTTTTEGAAAFLECSAGFIDKLKKAGILVPVPLPGRTIRYRVSDLEALAAGESVASKPADPSPMRRPTENLSERGTL